MRNAELTAGFMLAAYEGATSRDDREKFFQALALAIRRQPELGRAALPVLKQGLGEKKHHPEHPFDPCNHILWALKAAFEKNPVLVDEELAVTLAKMESCTGEEERIFARGVSSYVYVTGDIIRLRPDLRPAIFQAACDAAASADARQCAKGLYILADMVRYEPESIEAVLTSARRQLHNPDTRYNALLCFSRSMARRPDLVRPGDIGSFRQIAAAGLTDCHVAQDCLNRWNAVLDMQAAPPRPCRDARSALMGDALLQRLTASLQKIGHGSS